VLALPALTASPAGFWLAPFGLPAEQVSRAAAIRAVADTPHLVLNAPLAAARLGYPELSGLDLLELFAFVHPARFAVPSAAGLAELLGLDLPATPSAEPEFLRAAAATLLAEIGSPGWRHAAGARDSAQALARGRWSWAPEVLRRIPPPSRPEPALFSALPRWEDRGLPPKPRAISLEPEVVQAALAASLPAGAEDRPGQRAYAAAAAPVFAPREVAGAPNAVLAEAGTGIGKTLGYLAPALAWAKAAAGSVWVSTYTKALQRQLARDAVRLAPEPGRVVVRKGRENYLCLLNLEDAMQGAFSGRAYLFAQLAARWARYTKDGDLVGGDLPGWLPPLFGRGALAALSDRRGECVYAGCPHFQSCFIERAARAGAHADIVIANHALVMANAARARNEGREMTRIVFDEGHHLFDAADGAFRIELSGGEAIELRRWLLGPERATRGRRRGLAARLADAASYEDPVREALHALTAAAGALPADGWLGRVADAPEGPVEELLHAVRALVLARAEPGDTGFALETEIAGPTAAVITAAGEAARALEAMRPPLARLAATLEACLEAPPPWLDPPSRARIEAAVHGLSRRAAQLDGWLMLLARVAGPPDPAFVDWFAVDRNDAREFDVAIRRHWLDPTKPFAETVLAPAHGVLITSATLRARGAALAETDDWRDTEHRTGAAHLVAPPRRFATPSPFDYGAQARVLIVTDIDRRHAPSVAGAYAALIEAAGGGALGLFTAIARLRAVHARIAPALAAKGLPVLAQHVDPVDAGTLVDLFRADRNASLFGTDALRDGVDVPGEALRLIVMEGVPWPRRTVLHAARRAAFGGQAYDDLIIQGRIAQAFGRLIRKRQDRGVFVMLGAAVPSRLLASLPPGVVVERVPLATAHATVRDFLAPAATLSHGPSETGEDRCPA
jgi:ATP-dependent DNA helicase DinG